MIALYDHIQELRAELRGCTMTRRERASVQAELARPIVEQAELQTADVADTPERQRFSVAAE